MLAAEELVDAYIAAWNETDDHQRLGLLEQCWSDEGTLWDPLIPELVRGRKQVNDAIGQLREKYVGPGQRFVRATEVQEHHGAMRYMWALLGADGAELRRGQDVITRAADGRTDNLYMFFGDLKQLDVPVPH